MNKTMNFHYYIYLWMPFDCNYTLRNYICAQLIHIYIGFFGILLIITFDILNFLVIYHFIGHIYILKYNVRTTWSDEFNEQETKQYLIDKIKYHSFITR